MALFDRNPNESAYVHGKKHFLDVIKNNGPEGMIIWRVPEEDFNTNSVLTVMPGEAAIFINNGVIEQVFENGRFQLNTQNYPFISRLRNAFSGGISTFNCVVYFVRTATSFEINWGTPSPIQVRDKLLGIATKLRARGAYRITIGDPAVFLTKLAGNVQAVSQQQALNRYFANEFMSKIKSTITQVLNNWEGELLGIESQIGELEEAIQPQLEPPFAEYGLKMLKFSIAALDIDDDELRRRYDEIGMDAIGKMRNAQADKNVMGILGDDWARQQQVNIMTNLSQNTGGGAAGAGAGLGMGIGAMGAFGGMSQQMFQQPGGVAGYPQQGYPQGYPQPQTPPAPQAPAQDDPMEVLGKLKKLLDAGLIEQSEYDAKKKEVLARL